MSQERIKELFEAERRALADQDAIVAAGPMDAEAEQRFDTAQAAYEAAKGERERLQRHADNRVVMDAADEARAQYEHLIKHRDGGEGPPSSEQSEREALASFFRGEHGPDVHDVDLRAAARFAQVARATGGDHQEMRSILGDGGASGGSLVVPTVIAQTIYAKLEAAGAVRQLATVFQSDNANWTLPRVGTHGIGTQVAAQGTAIGGTDAVLSTITLNAYKFGQLVQLSNEMVDDSSFDIVGFVTENVARAVGRVIATGYATGSGSSTINGVVTATTGSVVTGGTLIECTAENLISLQHSVVQEYRDNGSYIMLDSTLGTVRKLRADAGGTTGPWLLEPPSWPGQPMTIFGRPIYTDFNIAAQGSDAKSVVFGDISRYYIKDTGSFRFERSDDYAFNTDLVSYRGVLRTDGDLVDTNATVKLIQKVAA